MLAILTKGLLNIVEDGEKSFVCFFLYNKLFYLVFLFEVVLLFSGVRIWVSSNVTIHFYVYVLRYTYICAFKAYASSLDTDEKNLKEKQV